MEQLGINPIFLISQCFNFLLCLVPVLLIGGLILYVLRQRPATPGQSPGESIQLGQPVKVLVGLGTAWMVIYPVLFVGVIIATFFGSDLFSGPGMEQSAPAFEPFFMALFPLHFLTIFLTLALIVFYIIHVIKNTAAAETVRIVLGVGLFFLPYVAMPIYYYLYIWQEHPPDWALAPSSPNHPMAPTTSNQE